MNKRLNRQYDIVNVDVTKTVVLLDPTGKETPADAGLSLIRQCDQAVEYLIGASRGLSKHAHDELRHLEQTVERIAITEAASESEQIAKVAVYREYANFHDKKSGLLATLLETCSDELARELVWRGMRDVGEF